MKTRQTDCVPHGVVVQYGNTRRQRNRLESVSVQNSKLCWIALPTTGVRSRKNVVSA